MIEKRTWFQRPLAALCLLSGITILSGYIILNSEGRWKGGGEESYRITLRHYGNDAREMETSAAIPLEDALSAIPGIDRITTQSENGQVRAFVSFRQKSRLFFNREDEFYDSVREAAQRVYETLPPSAQRPELRSSGNFHVPFWTAAVYGSSVNGMESLPDGALLERTIKPALNGIEGVGEVEIAGPGIKEIVIALDQERTAALGLSPADISAFLAADDALFSGGSLQYNGLEIPLRVDGRYSDLEALGEVLVPLKSPDQPVGGAVKLKAIADIREQEREAETLSRLNGKKTAIISVTATSGADPGALSRKIKKELEKFSSLPLEFHVLEDRGAEEAAAFKSVFTAALEASLLVALATVLLGWGKSKGFRNGFICALVIPLISIIAAAFLSAAGFPVNRKFLAGLAVGIGGAADAVILSAEGFGRAGNSLEGRSIFRSIWPPLVSGAATTVVVLLPLAGITGAEDIAVISYALGAVTLVSLALALTLLPPLFLWEKRPIESTTARRFVPLRSTIPMLALPILTLSLVRNFRRRLSRFFAVLIRFCMRRSIVFPGVSLLVSIAAILALAAVGADTSGEWAEDSVYIQIEFDGGYLKSEGDPLLASWALDLQKNPAVMDVQTGARTGSGYGLVTFDPGRSKIGEIRDFIRSRIIPGAFIYIPEPSPGDRIWTITVSGDEADKCRELARQAAFLCSADQGSGLSFVKETVLNFKQGSPRLTLVPRRELLAQGGLFFSFPADSIRRGVYGPVAYKRTGDNGEIDVRLKFRPVSGDVPERTGFMPSRFSAWAEGTSGGILNILNEKDILGIPLATAGGALESIRVGSLMEPVKTQEVSSIRRENRRRIASFSIRTNPGDPRIFRDKTMAALKDMELPPGYKIEFDPEAIRQAESLSGKFLNFIWAVIFCYMIIAAAEESFVLPLIILSSIPPSLAIPVLVLIIFKAPINAAVACALVAVSGMTVNASVISAGELWRQGSGDAGSVYRILKRRIPALAATTATTIAGAFPFLFLREGNNTLIRTLALVTILGVGTSFVCSLTLVPSWMTLFSRLRIERKH